MRILAVAPGAEVSGAERVLLRYLAAAAAAGAEVRCLAPAGRLAAQLAAAGHPVEPIPALPVPTGPRPAAAIRWAARPARAAATLRRAAADVDVVLVNGTLALPAVRLARPAAPVAWLVHDVVHRRSWTWFTAACRPAVTHALAVSEVVAAPLRRLGLPTTVVRNGTPWPVPARRPATPGERPVVGMNAMLTPWKGHRVLLQAAALMRTPATVELVGGPFPRDTAYAEELSALAAAPDLAGRVRLLGRVEDPTAPMASWSVAVNASTSPDAASLSVLEAMAMGIPSVVSSGGGSTEVLGAAGLVVPPGDPAALAAALDRLLTDPELHARCAQAGPAAVERGGLRSADAAERFLATLATVAGVPLPAAGVGARRR